MSHTLHITTHCTSIVSGLVALMFVGADEEFQLSMSFLRPAYGEVTMCKQHDCLTHAGCIPQCFLACSGCSAANVHMQLSACAFTCVELVIPS